MNRIVCVSSSHESRAWREISCGSESWNVLKFKQLQLYLYNL
mgnify:CR=1 FL=1